MPECQSRFQCPLRSLPRVRCVDTDQLDQLAALRERGTLSDDEFTAAKARLLGG